MFMLPPAVQHELSNLISAICATLEIKGAEGKRRFRTDYKCKAAKYVRLVGFEMTN